VGCTAHLAIQSSRSVKADEVSDYGDKKSYTRKRVNLRNEQVSPNVNGKITTRERAPVGTDPYRPPVGATPSDHVQLKIKSCNILPTGRED